MKIKDKHKYDTKQLIIFIYKVSLFNENLTKKELDLTKEILRSINWDSFLKFLYQSKTTPLAHYFIRKTKLFDTINEDISKELFKGYLSSQANFIKKTSELKALIDLFKSNEIDYLVLKGLPIAVSYYPDPATRTFKDIDVLIRESELDKINNLLLKEGYTIHKGLRNIDDYRYFHYHFIYYKQKDPNNTIEIHWSLTDRKKGHIDCSNILFLEKETIETHGIPINTLSRSNSFWYSCVHLSYHSFNDIRLIAEINKIGRILSNFEWEKVLQISQRTNTLNEVRASIKLSEELFGKFLMNDTRKNIKMNYIQSALTLSIVKNHIFNHKKDKFYDTESNLLIFLMRSGIQKKLHFLFRLLFPDKDTINEIYIKQYRSGARSLSRYFVRGLFMNIKFLIVTIMHLTNYVLTKYSQKVKQ